MSQHESINRVLSHVRGDVDPSSSELDELSDAASELEARALDAAAERGVDVSVAQVGSTARGTFVSGDRDIDLFVQFPAEIDEDDLEAHGLAIGQSVLPDGQRDFASHPYIKGEFRGFDVDVVPCFNVDSAEEIQSAVDRTPFHNEWLAERLTDELASDVRVAKRFLKGIGAYGANVATGGFSGFLTELLVLEHGGFIPLLEAAAEWSLPVGTFNPADHDVSGHVDAAGSLSNAFDAPLIVIDPTDPNRNVAAALSAENVGRFILNARQFLAEPAVGFFEDRESALSPDEAVGRVAQRGRDHVVVFVERPDDMVEDTFVPQLRKTRESVVRALDRREFSVVRSAEFANEDMGAILFALDVAELPEMERHEGPPVDNPHADQFLDAYEDNPLVVGPFIDGDRLVVEREREFVDAFWFLASDDIVAEVSVGASIEAAFRDDRDVVADRDALLRLADAFPDQFAAFADPNAIVN